MEQLKLLAKKPLNWVIFITAVALLYFIGGIIVKTIVSVLLLWVAYWITKFTGPYMKNRALRRTIDDMMTRRTNWDGTLKSASQMFEINKVMGYVMPYVFAGILIVSIWTAKPDAIKQETLPKSNTVEQIEETDTFLDIDNSSAEEQVNDNFENNSDTLWNNDVPGITILYTSFLNYDENNMKELIHELENRGYKNEEMKYTKSGVCQIIFMPGSRQNAIEIEIKDEATKDWFWREAETYLSTEEDCGIDYWSNSSISIWKDF